eukprot:scaffold218291_cov34-Prasinocladus_malaysianus.AAC.3
MIAGMSNCVSLRPSRQSWPLAVNAPRHYIRLIYARAISTDSNGAFYHFLVLLSRMNIDMGIATSIIIWPRRSLALGVWLQYDNCMLLVYLALNLAYNTIIVLGPTPGARQNTK